MTSTGILIHLCLLGYVSCVGGAFLTLIGTTLPDLQCLFHSNLQAVSRLFLAAGIPMIAASVLSAYLLKKWNLYLLMAAAMFLFGSSLPLVTATGYLKVAIIALIFTGTAFGVAISGAWYMCNILFPESAYALHALTVALSTGSLLCPIIAKPFLGKTQPIVSAGASLYENTTASMYEGVFYDPSSAQLSDVNIVTRNSSFYCLTHVSTIHTFYIILGFTAFPVAVSFCVFFLTMKYKSRDFCQSQTDHYIDIGERRSMVEVLYIVLLVVSIPCPFGLAYTYGSYLTTLGITGSLHLGVQKMAFLASMFWLSFLLGRSTAIAGSFCTKQIIILYICLMGQIASIIVLIVTDGTKEMLVWIGSLSLAFFTGPQFAALAAWSRYYILWTPIVVGLISMADFVGITFLPYVSGQLMSLYGQELHLYYCLGLAVFEVILVCILFCLGRYMGEIKEGNFEHGDLVLLKTG